MHPRPHGSPARSGYAMVAASRKRRKSRVQPARSAMRAKKKAQYEKERITWPRLAQSSAAHWRRREEHRGEARNTEQKKE